MAEYFIGIDPGNQGAIGIIGSDQTIVIHDMPTLAILKSDSTNAKKKNVLNGTALIQLLRPYSGHGFVTIEAVTAFPEMGLAAVASFMMGYGQILGIVEAMGFMFQVVKPKDWQHAMKGHLGPSKDASIQRACQLWPGVADQITYQHAGRTVKKDGRAEALLIAAYGFVAREVTHRV